MKTRTSPRAGARGFSLIELMVGAAIALVVTLVIFSVLGASESRRRTTSSVNDIAQSGGLASYLLDRAVRSAGSGYASVWDEAAGCLINAHRAGTLILPRAAALPAPFAAVSGSLRLAPVVIVQGASAGGSDVLIVMAGSAGFGEVATRATGPADPAGGPGVLLRNTIGYGGGDLVLLARQGQPACLLSQVQAGKDAAADGASATLPLAGAYFTAAGGAVNLADLIDSAAFVTSLGNAGAANPPQFRLYGVGDNRTLFAYDLLRIDGSDAPLPVAEGVLQLRAVYGVDTDGNRQLDAWVEPAGPTWAAAALLDGSPAAQANLRRILAVRIAVVLRSALPERTDVAPATLPLFADTAVATTVAIPAAERNFRHRVIESTVPLRNTLLLP